MEGVGLAPLSGESTHDEECERHRLGPALGTTALALNRYRIAPGETLPSGLHTPRDQEEVFVVLEGTATFETFPALGDCEAGTVEDTAGEEVAVEVGDAVRFAAGEFQSGRNEGEEPLVMLAIGAPRDFTDVRIPLPCPDCAARRLRLEDAVNGIQLACPPARLPTCRRRVRTAVGRASGPPRGPPPGPSLAAGSVGRPSRHRRFATERRRTPFQRPLPHNRT